MPRAPRIDIPGLVYHVTARGVKKLPIFHGDSDYQKFLRLLSLVKHDFPFQLHAYSLMTNHFHLLIQTVNSSLSKAMHSLMTSFSHYFNRKHKQVGHVFQGRFHSIPVQEDAYFTTVAAYIHNNAPRAGIVKKPEEYRWSNYGRLIRGEADPLVDPQFLLDYFGRDIAQQREKYRLFVEERLKKPEPVNYAVLKRMRFWGKPPVALTLSQQTL